MKQASSETFRSLRVSQTTYMALVERQMRELRETGKRPTFDAVLVALLKGRGK